MQKRIKQNRGYKEQRDQVRHAPLDHRVYQYPPEKRVSACSYTCRVFIIAVKKHKLDWLHATLVCWPNDSLCNNCMKMRSAQSPHQHDIASVPAPHVLSCPQEFPSTLCLTFWPHPFSCNPKGLWRGHPFCTTAAVFYKSDFLWGSSAPSLLKTFQSLVIIVIASHAETGRPFSWTVCYAASPRPKVASHVPWDIPGFLPVSAASQRSALNSWASWGTETALP